jgi:two-component system sensor histidine kinase MtrB
MSLRRTLRVLSLVLVGLTVSVASGLVVLRSQFHGVVTDLSDALESVRVAKQLRIELLEDDLRASGRASGPAETWDPARAHASAAVLFEEAGKHIQSREEAALVEAARKRVDAFFSAPDSGAGDPGTTRLAAQAHEALRHLVDHNLAVARSQEERIGRLDRASGLVGAALAALVVLVAAGLLLWGSRRILTPLVGLRREVARFAEEGVSMRLVPSGPTEIRDVAIAFNAMAEELQQQRAERLAMLGGVTHDLRNPISILRLAVERLAPGRSLPPEKRLRETLSMLERQIVRLDRMVGDFLDASRIDAGRLEMRFVDTDLTQVAQAAVELYRSADSDREIALVAPHSPVPVCGDPDRLEQALSNLLSNALKYSPAGSPVEVSLARLPGGEAVVAVADRGVGLSQEEQRAIFRPFARVGSLRDRVAGVGLGLAVAEKIVAAHGGRIAVHSDPGNGARFEIRLPASRIAPGIEEPAKSTNDVT